MKKALIALCSILVITCAKAQVITNYVKNPDFERYDTCPYKNDQINIVKYWKSVDSTYNISIHGNCSAEYYNACASVSIYSVPLGLGGYQYARSGNGMIGCYMFSDESPPPLQNIIIEIILKVVSINHLPQVLVIASHFM